MLGLWSYNKLIFYVAVRILTNIVNLRILLLGFILSLGVHLDFVSLEQNKIMYKFSGQNLFETRWLE